MKLTIENKGDATVVSVLDGSSPRVDPLAAGVHYTLDDDSTVAVLGYKPDLQEQLATAGRVLSVAFHAIVERLGIRTDSGVVQQSNVVVNIANAGSNAVRAILGDGVTDDQIEPGASMLAGALGYIELRELGHAPQQGGTPE